MTLRWHQVDINRCLLTFDETKNDERRSVPLVSHALELMKERSQVRRLDTDLVFPGRRYGDKPRDLTRPWKTALEAAEVKDFRWHDLRHNADFRIMPNRCFASVLRLDLSRLESA